MQTLSDETRGMLAEHRRKWIAMQLSQAPADRSVAEQGVLKAYHAAGLALPEHIVWCDGPREMARQWRVETIDSRSGGRRSTKAGSRAGSNVRNVLIDGLFSQTVATVERACGRAWRQSVAETLRLGRPSALSSAIVAATLQAIDEPPPRPTLRLRWWGRGNRAYFGRPTFRDSGYSSHELGWLGAYQFLHDRCGIVEPTAALAGLWQVASEVGWIVPHEGICWLSERHCIVKADAAERLHCGDGPALAYRDGIRIHMWKGVQVPSALIEMPSRITARMIDRELDPVVRRCMIDIITPEKYIAMGGAVRINQDETGILWRKLWWGFDAWAAVEVINGTPEPDGTRKHYYLQVPPTVRTAREAVAWTYGLSEHQYAQLKMRT